MALETKPGTGPVPPSSHLNERGLIEDVDYQHL
jgi:hypothetical protein